MPAADLHCPFCVKAQLALGWAGIGHVVQVWGYGEGGVPKGSFPGSPVVGPAGMKNDREDKGTKGLPILEILDGSRPKGERLQRESGDIVSLVMAGGLGGKPAGGSRTWERAPDSG